jgi:transcriptional regulator with XRE-family HTH domain
MDAEKIADEKTIAETVRARRRTLGLTQIQAAEAAGITRHTWGRVELGQVRGREDTLTSMERALDLRPGALVSLGVVPRGDALAAIRNKIIEHVKLLNTQPDLEQTLRDVIKRRSEQLLAELDELESVADDQSVEQRPR